MSTEPSPTFRLVVAVLIAAVSLLGAGVAWSASVSSNHSSDLNQQAQQEFLLRHQILTSAQAAVGEELRKVGAFQEQITAERILRQQADRFRQTQPDVAAILDEQAQGQAALARTTAASFFAAFPTVGPDGTVSYDRRQAVNNLLAQYVLTIAELGARRVGYPAAIAGVLALVAGCVLWPLIGTGAL